MNERQRQEIANWLQHLIRDAVQLKVKVDTAALSHPISEEAVDAIFTDFDAVEHDFDTLRGLIDAV